MNPQRFWQRAPGPYDSEIMERATGLKIDLYKDRDGDLHGEFTLSGGFGIYGENDFDDPDEFARHQREAMRFVRKLLAELERKPEEGGHHG